MMPDKTDIPGLDLKRQWYLYEQIRPHCKSNLAADLTCPKPKSPKPSSGTIDAPVSTSGDTEDGPPPTKKSRQCSLCKQSGHTKRTCPTKT